jgi:hypothetical protein
MNSFSTTTNQKSLLMQQIIPHTSSNVNPISQVSCNVSQPSLKHNGLCSHLNENAKIGYGDVALKHRIFNEAIKDKNYSNNLKKAASEMISCSNAIGITDASQGTLCKRSDLSESTFRRCLRILEQDGYAHVKKNGWGQTNTVTLLPIYYELNNKAVNLTGKYNNLHISDKRDLNITHYDEYVSHFANTKSLGLNTPKLPHLAPSLDLKNRKSEYSEIAKSESTRSEMPQKPMKSEWEVKNEVLDKSLSEIVEKEIPENQRKDAVLTLKRINAPLEAKLELLKEVGQLAKVMIIANIGGLLFSRFKKMGERMKNGNLKNNTSKDVFMDTLRLSKSATIETERRLRARGIIDPILQPGSSYEELERYRSEHGALYPIVLRELSQKQCSETEPSISPKQTWADVAYS